VTAILWYRGHDLRRADNEALVAAARHDAVVPCYLHVPDDEGDWPLGGASAWWLHRSLRALDEAWRAAGSRLLLRRGPSTVRALLHLAEECGATAVYAHRRSEPAAAAVEVEVARALGERGIKLHLTETHTLAPLGAVRTGEGGPYKVFTPFWRALQGRGEPADPVAPVDCTPPPTWPASVTLDALALEPSIDWHAGLRASWTPGEAGATARLRRFCHEAENYDEQRNRPDVDGTSSLSPHLRFGEISPRQAWHAARAAAGDRAEPWLRQLAWRDFGHHLLHHLPHTVDEPLRPEFAHFPWTEDAAALRRWQTGRTGFPFVDAGMRQLWRTGWMHNRVRMVVASFLVKDLMLPWQAGARWFWDTLVDADLANNTLGWQWTAGCGADAAPYFRVFNPITQGEKFDPEASYVRRWVGELADLAPRDAHRPWELPLATSSYPAPMIDHGLARKRALAAYDELRREVRA
jgi:deoxyribodipyrimidine photo-lyase